MALTKEREVSKITSIIAPTIEKEIKMSIDQNAVQFIIERLTDLYPDPISASVRETISNAIDASQLVDNPAPIKITSPTSFRAAFTVQDFGIGMSPEDIENIYSSYGASTKRKDFSQIGAFGLGAKAPLSYCDEFSGISVKNGISSSFIVSRKTTGNTVEILSTTETDAHSGTQITIPVKNNDVYSFCQAIKSYKTQFSPVTISVDDNPIASLDEYMSLEDIVLDAESNTTARVWIKIESINNIFIKIFKGHDISSDIEYTLSGWMYRAPENNYHSSQSNIIVELKPGIVDFSSSRDDIIKNNRSEKLVKSVIEQVIAQSPRLLELICLQPTMNLLDLLRTLKLKIVEAKDADYKYDVSLDQYSKVKLNNTDFISHGIDIIQHLAAHGTPGLVYDVAARFRHDYYQSNKYYPMVLEKNYPEHNIAYELKEFNGVNTVSNKNTVIQSNIQKANKVSPIALIWQTIAHRQDKEMKINIIHSITAENEKSLFRTRSALTKDENMLVMFAENEKEATEAKTLISKISKSEVNVYSADEVIAYAKTIRSQNMSVAKNYTAAKTKFIVFQYDNKATDLDNIINLQRLMNNHSYSYSISYDSDCYPDNALYIVADENEDYTKTVINLFRKALAEKVDFEKVLLPVKILSYRELAALIENTVYFAENYEARSIKGQELIVDYIVAGLDFDQKELSELNAFEVACLLGVKYVTEHCKHSSSNPQRIIKSISSLFERLEAIYEKSSYKHTDTSKAIELITKYSKDADEYKLSSKVQYFSGVSSEAINALEIKYIDIISYLSNFMLNACFVNSYCSPKNLFGLIIKMLINNTHEDLEDPNEFVEVIEKTITKVV